MNEDDKALLPYNQVQERKRVDLTTSNELHKEGGARAAILVIYHRRHECDSEKIKTRGRD